MLLLAVDTSGRQGGITLARGSASKFEVVESAAIQGGTFSAELIPQISELLTRHSLSVRDLEALVAVSGPGSFTGLRVGLTALKGIADALQLPIAAVSALELLAFCATSERVALPPPAVLLTLIDAGRNEVYAGIYERQGTTVLKQEELLLAIPEALMLAAKGKLRAITADPAIAAVFHQIETVTYPGSEAAARLGLQKLLAEDTVNVLVLDANYIRKSEAEYLRKMQR
jgi:tRNA threonylcarbamoyladenosine biosynthesis protein TsaB